MKIEINFDEKTNQVTLNSSKPIRIDDLMTIMFTGQLMALRKALPAPGTPEYEPIRDLLYDQYNSGASQVLSMFCPDKELRPDITAEALLEAENKYIREKVSEYEKSVRGVSEV